MTINILIRCSLLRGKRSHTRNRHLRNHRGLSVACPNGLSVAFLMECNFSVVLSKEWSLVQWFFTGSSQWIFSGIFQLDFTFVTSGVIFCPRHSTALICFTKLFYKLSWAWAWVWMSVQTDRGSCGRLAHQGPPFLETLNLKSCKLQVSQGFLGAPFEGALNIFMKLWELTVWSHENSMKPGGSCGRLVHLSIYL